MIRLKNRANFWQAQHKRAVKREAILKKNERDLNSTVRRQKTTLEKNASQIEALKAKLVWLQEQLFGSKTERDKETKEKAEKDNSGSSEESEGSSKSSGKRGQKPGSKGHGRRNHDELPAQLVEHDIAEKERLCPCCGLPYHEMTDTEDSEEVHWDVHIVRRIHKRKRYKKTCCCPMGPKTLTAPIAPKLIPKGMFSTDFWVQLLIEKYLHQRPLYRIRQALSIEGMRRPSQGTLTGGLQKMKVLLQPLYARILERNRQATHWHMDETRWLVFTEVEGKTGYRWWLWVAVTKDTCVYLLEPSRSASVPGDHLGEKPEGIISADRYSAYKALSDGIDLRIAFCWAHVRRDFKNVRNGYKKLKTWGQEWMDRIGKIYHINNERLAVRYEPDLFEQKDQELRKALADMVEQRDEELADKSLHSAKSKTLTSLCNHWKGLMIFVDHPNVPMDNNEAERRLRNPIIGRKNYYGSGSVWSGMLSAVLFTLFQTLLVNHINPKQFLLAYFNACAQNGGNIPENIDLFLPWNLSEEQKETWRYRDKPG